ncbi:MAG: BCCT family transporter [Rhodovibrio sp.]|nr:BCCT family transporter [Rhodovibrio sp.]
MQAQSGPLKGLNPTVTLIASFVVMVFVIFGAVATETAGGVFTAVKDAIIGGLKWYYIGVVAFFLFFVICLMFSRFGPIRLGDDDDRPRVQPVFVVRPCCSAPAWGSAYCSGRSPSRSTASSRTRSSAKPRPRRRPRRRSPCA